MKNEKKNSGGLKYGQLISGSLKKKSKAKKIKRVAYLLGFSIKWSTPRVWCVWRCKGCGAMRFTGGEHLGKPAKHKLEVAYTYYPL